jgi:segregation and condensation protein A
MPDNEDDFEEYTPQEARDILISRLLAYKQFKNAAAALNVRMESEGRMHARHAGPEPQFIGLLPDWLEGVTLHSLVVICADLAARRGVILLEAEHIVSRPMSLERVVELINRRLEREKSLTFSDLIKGQNDLRSIVVGFLGVLELYHRGMIDIEQADSRAEIELFYRDTDSWEPALEPSSNISPVDEYIEKLAEINEKSVQVSEENIDATIAILEEK